MKSSSTRSGVVLALGVAAASGTAACGDALPTQTPAASFALSDGSAQAFRDALTDVQRRILPTLSGTSRSPLAPALEELTSAIEARDQAGLRRAIDRAESALARLEARVGAETVIDPELDAVRLILDEARPLTTAQARTAVR